MAFITSGPITTLTEDVPASTGPNPPVSRAVPIEDNCFGLQAYWWKIAPYDWPQVTGFYYFFSLSATPVAASSTMPKQTTRQPFPFYFGTAAQRGSIGYFHWVPQFYDTRNSWAMSIVKFYVTDKI